MLLLSIALVIAHLLAFVAALVIWRLRSATLLEWTLTAAIAWVFVLVLFFTGAWGVVGYPLRYAALLCLAIATFLSWRRARGLPLSRRGGLQEWLALAFLAAAVVAGGVMNVVAWRGRFPDRESVELFFPLLNGTYHIGQGGSSRALNTHRPVREQQYALDINRLNRAGMIAGGLLPRDLERYAIFGAFVVSPCNGEIAESENGLPDLIPPETDRKNTKGNYIVVNCRDSGVEVLLAHLKRGSLQGGTGAPVSRGQLLALVGNSGNTSHPHLHLQATRNGEGVPMTFGGRFLARNDLISVD
jgi:hypothetical protein